VSVEFKERILEREITGIKKENPRILRFCPELEN